MDSDTTYLTKDARAGFPTAEAAAHFFEDRFIEIQAAVLIMGLAESKKDYEGYKFAVTQLRLLCQEVVGVQHDTREFPEPKAPDANPSNN